ncbi:DoxX family protein [Streptomyces sp. NPDC049813]|uniref:DoxX family protein n=1 Tax=Streptomyces sp. NPDC049813 TaxID=3365597 RepID=UPI00378E9173
MHLAYWVVATLLALFYFYGGALKLARSRDQLRPMMAWVDALPMAAVRAIGALEVLGALGLLLPPLTGTAPWLACAAALGFTLLQCGATAVHLRMGDRQVALNIALLVTAAVSTWLAATWW